jgi:hypothetical protein
MRPIHLAFVAGAIAAVVVFAMCGGESSAQSVNGWNLGAGVSVDSGTTDSGGADAGPAVLLTQAPYIATMPGSQPYNIVCDGDSLRGEQNVLTDGGVEGGSTNQFESSCEQLAQRLGSGVTYHNSGRGGYSCAQMLATAGAWEYAFVRAGAVNVLILQCGINDVAFQDAGAYGVALIASRYQSLATAAKSNGFQKVLLEGPESTQYFDPASANFTGVSLSALDTAAAALYPTYVDGYLSLIGDQVMGVVAGGSALDNLESPAHPFQEARLSFINPDLVMLAPESFLRFVG